MELLLVNLSAPRRVTEGGRDYVVAPLSLIVPGVLNGSQGALYYPPEEIQRTTEAWNGIPITLRHPRKNGQLVPAHDGGIVLGDVRNARFENKLTAEGWFDVGAIQSESPQLLRSIESGEQGELSTGLYTENKPVKNGEHNGRAYTHVATNYRPDHLAILPDEKGACSVGDGCGVNVNKESRPVLERLADLYHQTANMLTGLLGGKFDPNSNDKKEGNMPLTAEQRKTMVDNLIGCCWEEDGRSELEQLTDNQLTSISTMAEKTSELELVANAAREALDAPEDLATNAMPAFIKKAIAKKKGKGDEDEEEDEEEEGKPVKKKTENKTTKPLTEDEWLDQAPASVRAQLDFAANVMAEQRSEAIERVTANLSGDEKGKVEKHLAMLSLEQIRDFEALAPKPRPTANYGTTPSLGSNQDKEPPMGQPTWNFDPEPANS